VRALIGELYAQANGLPVPWTGHTAKILASFLAANRGWPLAALERCVRHRFASEDVNLGEDPVRWINKMCNYVRGPLNRFGEPLKNGIRDTGLGTREMPGGARPRSVRNGTEGSGFGNREVEAVRAAWDRDINARAAAKLEKLKSGSHGQ
jgi:hypothetical protein